MRRHFAHFKNKPSLSFMMLALWMAVAFLRSPRGHACARGNLHGRILGDDLDAFHDTCNTAPGKQKSPRHIAKIARSIGRSSKRVFNPGSMRTGRNGAQAQLPAQRHVDAYARLRWAWRWTFRPTRHFQRCEYVVGNQLPMFGARAPVRPAPIRRQHR
jgi:hypothetical protein